MQSLLSRWFNEAGSPIQKGKRFSDWLKKRNATRGILLMYHRVSEPALDPWGLSVSPSHFKEQMQVLRDRFTPLSLADFVAVSQKKEIPPRTAVVTFDDGYVDNLLLARPILERHQIPAVIFLITGYIGGKYEFWWDELGEILLQPERLPEFLKLNVRGKEHAWNLDKAGTYTEADRQIDHNRKPWEAAQRTRLAFFYEVWKVCLPLSYAERRSLLNQISEWGGVKRQPCPENLALAEGQVKELAESRYITLGAHTATHPLLPQLTPSDQMEEILTSKTRIEDIIQQPIHFFSYPHGEYSKETAAITREIGFRAACTTLAQTAWHQTDPYQLPRFQVEDWNAEEFNQHLLSWFLR